MSPSPFYERSYGAAASHAREIVNSSYGDSRRDAWLCFGSDHRAADPLLAAHPPFPLLYHAAAALEELCNPRREKPPTTELARPARNAGFLRSFRRDVFGFVSIQSLCFPLLAVAGAGAGSRRGFCAKLILEYRAHALVFTPLWTGCFAWRVFITFFIAPKARFFSIYDNNKIGLKLMKVVELFIVNVFKT